MSVSSQVRQQLLNSFRAELQEHIQTMSNGLLALEQQTVSGQKRQALLDEVFRAAHSLKGAARAVGATAIEQLAHALEDVLDGLRKETVKPRAEMFTACYGALDAIQESQTAYEAGALSPPALALQALLTLEPFRVEVREHKAVGLASVVDEAGPPEPVATAAVPASAPAPAVAPSGPGETSTENDETVRVRVAKLDALMAQLSELLVAKIRAEQRVAALRQFQEQLAQRHRRWLGTRSAYRRLQRQLAHLDGQEALRRDLTQVFRYLEEQDELRELGLRAGVLARAYANDMQHMALIIDELESEVKQVRMLPFNTIAAPFRRMVRDLAQAAGKDALLRIVGGETELDKQVLEAVKDPLMHLLRNAIDHGIESPDARAAAGKLRRGAITLLVEQAGNDVLISVADDGAGLDIEAVRKAVIRREGSAAADWDEEALVQAIFQPGVTTSRTVTDMSGRGVGLDVVRRNVEALHGRIDVHWRPGSGAAFTLRFPLRLGSTRGLLLQVAGEQFALPLSAVERIITIKPESIIPLEGRDAILFEGQAVALVKLADILDLPVLRPVGHGSQPAVILVIGEKRLAILVDALLGEQEIVIKNLGGQLVRVAGLAGATVIGDGTVVLVLNAADLIRLATQGQPRPVFSAEPPELTSLERRARQVILIVDDSITTRTLEKNILEAAGYSVRLATDGEEAWTLLQRDPLPDIVISDVAMPRMDGIALTKRVKGDARTADLPLILVTSMESTEDKARGVEAGADAYITKGSFNQSNLLETIEQLI